MRRAAAAMQQGKHRGGSVVECNDAGERLYVEERFQLERAMRQAMQRDELALRYQPQVDRDGRLRGLEALIEWRSAELGRVETETFIRLAEETGAILPIGAWVLDRACRQLAEWRQAGFDTPRVAVNVSPQQFASPSFVTMVREVITRTGVEGRLLELEVTESSILRDLDGTARRMAELRALGVRIAVDDFGVGYSPLSYLHRLPLDVVKVDRSFVRQITKSGGSLPVVHTITVLAHHRGLQVVAEGVETAEELELVRAARCDLVQGFLFGAAMSAAEVVALMAAPERLAAHMQSRAASSY
jgi:EAL domain-containing protein (putative c-di-GMP-specific phosphodiesterase class I)